MATGLGITNPVETAEYEMSLKLTEDLNQETSLKSLDKEKIDGQAKRHN